MAARRPMNVVIFGRGRLGGSLFRALRRSGHRVRLAPGQSRLGTSDLDAVLLCVPDRAVATTTLRLARPGIRVAVVAHCAGALDLGPLEPLRALGSDVGSLHPLQAVPSRTTLLDGHAAIEASSPVAARILTQLARDAGLKPFRLAGSDRALYHAAAALASNGLVAVFARASALLSACGVSEGIGHAALVTLLQSALAGIAREGLPRGLTGPIARGDVATVQRHLGAIAQASRDDLPLYIALSQALVPISALLGQADPAGLEAIGMELRQTGRALARGRNRAPRAERAKRRPVPARASREPRSS